MRVILLLVIITTSFCLTGCSKDGNFTSYIRGKIDGVAFESTSNITANTPEPSPISPADPTLRIIGNWGTNEIKLFILTEASSIGTGTYIFESDKRRYGQVSMNGSIYYAGPQGMFTPPGMLGSGSITITSISKKSVKGNFQFTTASTGGVFKTVTDGEFHVKRD